MNRFAVFIALAGCLVACDPVPTPADPTKATQAQKAEQAANSIDFTDNAEIDNIQKRLQLTANPGLLGYIILLNEMGQPVMYTSVKGKVTSGTKRLTRPVQKYRLNCGQYCDETLNVSPSDEGTWGTSGEYVYFWTQSGQYVQWNGKYLYSDQPFRLSIKPLVINEVPAGVTK